jgi:hypothetical protein
LSEGDRGQRGGQDAEDEADSGHQILDGQDPGKAFVHVYKKARTSLLNTVNNAQCLIISTQIALPLT